MHDKHYALGLDYDQAQSTLIQSLDLQELNCQDSYLADRAYHIQMLDNWAAKYRTKYGNDMKPKAVFVTATGGGLRSSLWSFRVLQQLDSITGGIFGENIRLMSGASGGMFGTAYYRELQLQQLCGKDIHLNDAIYHQNLSRDMLNRIAYRNFTEVFLPGLEIEIDGHIYDKDRGYAFDQQLALNLPELAGRRLGDYQEYELGGDIPLLVLSPTIINQGRKLFVSSSPFLFWLEEVKSRTYILQKPLE